MAKRHAVRASSTEMQELDRLAPAALPLLPMIYVAWADGVLTPSELRTISQKVREQSLLDEQTRTTLSGEEELIVAIETEVLHQLMVRMDLDSTVQLPDEIADAL